MKSPCDSVHEFIDGELSLDERAAFFEHMDGCSRCSQQVEELLELDASLEEALSAGPAKQATQPPRRLNLRRPVLWVGSALAVAAAIAVAVVKPWADGSKPAPLAHLESRPIEARVGPPEMDVHSPYDPQLGGAHRQPASFRELAELEKRGHRVLAARLLQVGDLKAAGAVLDNAREDKDLENERAVLALLEGRPQEALDHLDAQAKAPAPQVLWNRALALRDLGLPHAATLAFEAIAANKEDGWSAEARERARAATQEAARWEQRFERVMEEGRALVAEQKAPSATTLTSQRDFVRLFFYDAVRSAGTKEQVRRLRPVAVALDQSYGGDSLGRYLDRVEKADFSRRRPLAERYKTYAVSRWQNIVPAELKPFLAQLRTSGQSDILVGALLASRIGVDDGREFGALARAQKDPWLDIAADEVIAQDPMLPLPQKEALIRRGIRRASEARFELRRLRLEKLLIELLIRQHRSHEALPLLSELRTRARRLDDLTMERLAIFKMATLAHFRRQRPLLAAYASEALLWPNYTCLNRQEVVIALAQDAFLAGDLAAVRSHLRAMPSCGTQAEANISIAQVYSDLARQGDASDRQALQSYLAPGVSDGPADRLLAKVLEQRAVIKVRSTAQAELLTSIASLEAMPDDDEDRNKALLLGYQALAFQAIDDGHYAEALEFIARERRTKIPTGCVLGMIAEPGRMGIVLRNASDSWTGQSSRLGGPFTGALPADVRSRLAGCGEVAVVAEPAFHGQSRLLDSKTAWSFHESSDVLGPSPSRFRRHVVVSDVEPPAALNLEPLPAWQGAEQPAIQEHLVGVAATPTRTLAAIADADLVQFHTHGLLDASVADAAFLALSPDTDGNYALTAGQIRRTRLTGHPVVVLGACNGAEADVNYNPEWSLPVAFVKSGARAVFAVSIKIPVRASRTFFQDLMGRLQSGASPAHALRDLRTIWKGRGEEWSDDVLVFE